MAPFNWREWEALASPPTGIGNLDDESVCIRSDHVEVLVAGASGRCYYTSSVGTAWQPWLDLGGRLASAPTALSWADDRLDVFVLGSDQRVFHRFRQGPEWAQIGVPEPKWAGPLAPEKLVGRISAVSWGVNRIDLFARAESSPDCLHLFWDDALGGWGPKRNGAVHWESLGGPLATMPTALTWGIKDRVDVFAVFEDGRLHHRFWEKGWGQPWEPLGDQVVSSRPAVVSWGGQRIDVVARAGDQVVHLFFDPASKGWHKEGGKITWEPLGTPSPGVLFKGAPTAVSWGPNRLDLFAQGTDNELWWRAWRPGWSGWSTLGGRVRGEIAAVAPTTDMLRVLVTGRDEWAGRVHSRLGL